MTIMQQVLTIAAVVAGTVTTRFLPFIIFPADKPTPEYIKFLVKVLPSAALGMLVVYCLKNVDITSGTHAVPEIISIAVVCCLHIWKRAMLLSIAGGTFTYIILVNYVF